MPGRADCFKKARKSEFFTPEMEAYIHQEGLKRTTISDPEIRKARVAKGEDNALASLLKDFEGERTTIENALEALKVVPEPEPVAETTPETTPAEAPVTPSEPEATPETTEETTSGEEVRETPTTESEPSEPAPPEDPLDQPTLTGVKFEALDKEMARMNLPPISRRPKGTNQEAFDKAHAQFTAAPALEVDENGVSRPGMDAGTKLIDELTRKPRGWKDEVELNVGRLEVKRRKAELSLALENLNEARAEDKKNARALYETAEMRLQAALRVAAYAQSTGGKTFRASQDWLAEDFTLVDLAMRWRANVNGGAPLTDGTDGTKDQVKEVADAFEKIKQSQAHAAMLEEALENATAENKELVATMDILVRDVERAQKKGQRSERIKKALKERGDAALANIDAILAKTPSPGEGDTATTQQAFLSPDQASLIKNYVVYGATRLADKFVTLGEFTSQMVTKLGEWALSHASQAYREAVALYHETETSVRGENAPSPEAVVDGIDPEEGPTKRDVWDLARAHVIAGKRGTSVMDSVFADLQEAFPEITREEVATLFTGYGTIIEPSKKETEVELNRVRNLERTALKILDVRRGQPPKRTGFQRGEQDVEVRELERKFRKLLKESGIQTTDQKKQLRTALGAAKRRMENEIEAMKQAIASGEARPAAERSGVEFDEEATILKAKLEATRKRYNEVFKKEGLTMDQRQEALVKTLDRQIKEEEAMIKKGVFKRPKGEPVKETPEIAQRREKLAELRAERRALDPSQTPLAQAKASTAAAIERYRDLIENGMTAAKAKTPVDPDAELAAMLEVKQALAEEVRELRRMLPGSATSEKAQIARALKSAEASVRRLQGKLDRNDLSTKPKRETAASRDDAVRAMREQAKALNKELARRRREALPKKSPEEIRVQRALASLRRQKKELERRKREGDFSPRVRAKPIRDARVKEARREVESLKRDVNEKMLEAKRKQREFHEKLGGWTWDVVANVPRSIQASIDVGAFGRQGWLAVLADVGAILTGDFSRAKTTLGQFGKNFAFTEKWADQAEGELEADPDYQDAIDSGMQFTSWRPGHSLLEMEEAHRSRLAKKFVPGVIQSERAYVTYLNAIRLAHFKVLKASLAGKEGGLTEANLKNLTRHINAMTGRGNLPGVMERSAEGLALLLFSPKYWWSRLEMLGGTIWSAADAASFWHLGKKETKLARQIIAKERARITLGLVAMYSLVNAAASAISGDDEDEDNPAVSVPFDLLSTDFGKIKFRNGTRIDPGAGLLQNMVFVNQMIEGKRVSVMSGDDLVFRGPDRNFQGTDASEALRMLRKKASPVASTIWDLADDQTDVLGRPTNPESEAVGWLLPISVQEAHESYTELGVPAGLAAIMLNIFGFGTSTYGGDEDEITLERKGAEFLGGIFGVPPERYDKFYDE